LVLDPELSFYLIIGLVSAGLVLSFVVRRSLRAGAKREVATGVVVVACAFVVLAIWQHYSTPPTRVSANASRVADPCKGSLPAPGTKFSGEVRYVDDGDSLCIGTSDNPNTWVEVRLDDFNAPGLRSNDGQNAKSTLEGVALGRSAQCIAGNRFGDQVVAHCILISNSIGYLMHRAGVREGGRQR
jgi:micrococcal nuclease